MNTRHSPFKRLGWTLIPAAIALLGAGGVPAAEPAPLQIQVITSSAESLYANFTLVLGQHEAVLVDAPFTCADAHRVVAAILDSGRALKTIYITHDHPDHFFCLEVITDAFPNARAVSQATVVDDIWKSIPIKLKRWSPLLGANGPRHPTAPVALDADHFELEGHRIEVLGPMQGDHVHATALWIPDAKTLVAGDILFNQMHLWFGECRPAERAAWTQSVQRLQSLGATTVVAGHKKPGLPDDASALQFTRQYLETFETDVSTSKSAKELAGKIQAAFPGTIDVLGDFLLGNSSKVAMGEMPPWDE